MFILKYILPHFIVLVKVGGIASLSANLTVSLQLGGQSMSTTTVQGEATATSNASLPLFTDFPEQSQTGQYGTNRCGTTDSQNSNCQTLYLNSLDDFCLWAPPVPNSTIGDTETEEVAWCIQSGHGSRIIPQNTLTSAHFVKTSNYIQVTGTLNQVSINLASSDQGGELDPHGATGLGNPIGAMVLTSAFGGLQQVKEWTQFIGADQFCFRACLGENAAIYCNHIYDIMGCYWNMPANYTPGIFESCQGDLAQPMGLYPPGTVGVQTQSKTGLMVAINDSVKALPTLYNTNQTVYTPMPVSFNGWSQFYQGQPITPSAGPIAPSSQCQRVPSIGLQAIVTKALNNSTGVITGTNNLTVIPQPTPSRQSTSDGESSQSNGKGHSAINSSPLPLRAPSIHFIGSLVALLSCTLLLVCI